LSDVEAEAREALDLVAPVESVGTLGEGSLGAVAAQAGAPVATARVPVLEVSADRAVALVPSANLSSTG
jgi:hypothetical protein